jgi:hypothetical protein
MFLQVPKYQKNQPLSPPQGVVLIMDHLKKASVKTSVRNDTRNPNTKIDPEDLGQGRQRKGEEVDQVAPTADSTSKILVCARRKSRSCRPTIESVGKILLCARKKSRFCSPTIDSVGKILLCARRKSRSCRPTIDSVGKILLCVKNSIE